MPESTEQQRIARAVGGDEQALQELLLDNYDRLAAHLSGKLPSDLQATVAIEDVLQETFSEAVRRIAAFEPRDGAAFYRWLATIADHRLIDIIRAARAVKRGAGQNVNEPAAGADSTVGDLLSLLAAHEHTPSRSVAGHEALAAVNAALGELKEDYGQVLRLRYFDGLTVAETARRLGRTETAVQMLCHRAIEALREEMGRRSRFFSHGA